jgi:hypothetical protein
MGRNMGKRCGGGAASERLSALKVRNLMGPGYFADGGNLYFRVASVWARGWIFRYTVQGRAVAEISHQRRYYPSPSFARQGLCLFPQIGLDLLFGDDRRVALRDPEFV